MVEKPHREGLPSPDIVHGVCVAFSYDCELALVLTAVPVYE